jgi:serine phosphatase RsbU (regulator of sigma subunit)
VKIIIAVWIILLTTFQVRSQVLLKEANLTYTSGTNIFAIEDKEGKYSIADIEKMEKEGSFPVCEREHPNFGYSKSTFWIKIHLKNENPTITNWVIHFETSLVDYLDYMEKDSTGKIIMINQTGRLLSFESRGDIKEIGFAFNTNIAYGQEKSLYFRVKSDSPLALPIYIRAAKQHAQVSFGNHVYYGIYAGVLLAMIFYNAFVYLSLRDISYLLYVGSICCTLITFLSLNGFLFKYIHPENPEINYYLGKLGVGGINFFTAFFAIKFLDIKKYSKVMYYLQGSMMFFGVFAAIISVANIKSSAVNTVTIFNSLTLLSSGILCSLKGNKYARFYTLSWIFFIFGGLGNTLRNAGIAPTTFFTNHSHEIGSALEALLLSIALGDRYRIYRRESEDAVKKNLEIQQKANEELEGKVQERTSELREAVEELNQTNEELESTLNQLEIQKKVIQQKNHDLTASINYAKRIQDAMLPSKQEIKKYFQNFFILFKPRDIVSGDFYWFHADEHNIWMAAADCTGHGVPGAIMSMIGCESLNEVIVQQKIEEPAKALTALHLKIKTSLKQETSKNRDGMDISLVLIQPKTNRLLYAGAKNHLYWIDLQDKLQVFHANRFSIGGEQREKERVFSQHEIPLNAVKSFYLLSDGFQDQFGGENDQKYTTRRMRQFLQMIHQQPIESQQKLLEAEIDNWIKKGKTAQIDDMLVIGVKNQ